MRGGWVIEQENDQLAVQLFGFVLVTMALKGPGGWRWALFPSDTVMMKLLAVAACATNEEAGPNPPSSLPDLVFHR
jgi:hypothetical protein